MLLLFSSPRHSPAWFIITLVAVGYFVLAMIALSYARPVSVAAPFWPASGLAWLAVGVYGYRGWAGVFLGAFAANSLALDWSWALLIAVGNLMEAIYAVYLYRVFMSSPTESAGLRPWLWAPAVVIAASAVSAMNGLAVQSWAGLVGSLEAAGVFVSWWVGDMMGLALALTVVLLFPSIARAVLHGP